MPFINMPTGTTYKNAEAIVRVYIDSIRRFDVKVGVIRNATGLAASVTTLRFPRSKYDQDPAVFGDKVEIYINPHLFRAPFFRGLVVRPSRTQARDTNEIFYDCYDERFRLNDSCCSRNYNERDEKTQVFKEELNTRAIIHEIWSEYRSHQVSNGNTNYLRLNLASFPNVFPGSLNLQGVPHGDALQQILQDYGGESYKLYVVHGESTSYLKAFEIGSGFTARVVRGTDHEYSARQQPFGVANIGNVDKVEEYEQVVNHLVAYGAEKIYETCLSLTKFWDTTIETAVLANWDKYTKRKIQDDAPNPDYDPRAEFVATRYIIPKLTDNGIERQVKVLSDLVQEFVFEDADGNRHTAKPFLVYQYSGDADYSIEFDGFSIVDDELVVFTKPFVKQVTVDGGTVTNEVPSEMYLNFAFQSTARISYDTNKQGTVDRDKKQIVTRDEFQYKAKSGNFDLSWNAVTKVITATYNAGTTGVIDESADLQAWALRRVLPTSVVPETFHLTLPRLDLQYKLGQRLRENNTLTNTNIVELAYDLDARETSLIAMAE